MVKVELGLIEVFEGGGMLLKVIVFVMLVCEGEFREGEGCVVESMMGLC